jgi:hypothetical protein
MARRTRTIASLFVLSVGVITPFVLGAISGQRLTTIHSGLGFPPISGAEFPCREAAFRSRFDTVQMGMTEYDVALLLGSPSHDEWMDFPTHGESWFSYEGRVSHRIHQPPDKLYWIFVGIGENPHWWSGDRWQAFVIYDQRRKVCGKFWLEDRR